MIILTKKAGDIKDKFFALRAKADILEDINEYHKAFNLWNQLLRIAITEYYDYWRCFIWYSKSRLQYKMRMYNEALNSINYALQDLELHKNDFQPINQFSSYPIEKKKMFRLKILTLLGLGDNESAVLVIDKTIDVLNELIINESKNEWREDYKSEKKELLKDKDNIVPSENRIYEDRINVLEKELESERKRNRPLTHGRRLEYLIKAKEIVKESEG